jgi:RND family efflux transporter MFP subunit
MRTLTPTPLSLAVLSLWLGAAGGCARPAVEKVDTTEAVPVAVVPARLDALRSVVIATGTIAPAPGGDWTITAPEAGRIAELPKNEGEAVKVGDLLVRFDIPSLTSELAARQAEVRQATARAEKAKADVTRISGLVERGIQARKDLLDAQLQQTEADEALKQAQTALTAATTLASRATVTARFAGVVAKRWHNIGDLVDAATTDPVLRVIDPTRAEVVASVPVADLGRVYMSRPAEVMNPGTGAAEAALVMTKPATVDTGSSTADVRLRFVAPTTMSIGTAVGVQIIADERASALIVPAAAIVRDGGEVFVMLAGADNKAHKQPVTLGLTTREFAQIMQGLKAGDSVIVRGQDGLPDGATITVAK